MDKGVKENLRQQISKAFGYVDKTDLKVKDSGRTVEFVVESQEITFDKLCALSKLLGTTQISLNAETRHGGVCSSCDYEYGVTVVTIADAVIPEAAPARLAT